MRASLLLYFCCYCNSGASVSPFRDVVYGQNLWLYIYVCTLSFASGFDVKMRLCRSHVGPTVTGVWHGV